MSISLYKSIFCGIMVLGEIEFLAPPPFLLGRWCQARVPVKKRGTCRCRSIEGRRALTPETMERNHLTVPPRTGALSSYFPFCRPAPRRVVSGLLGYVVRADEKCPQHAARTKQPIIRAGGPHPPRGKPIDCGKTLYRERCSMPGAVK